MSSTSDTIDSSGSVQPSSASSEVPSGQAQRGWKREESMAAMATAAVSVRVVAAPGRPVPDSSSRSTDSTLTPGSYVVRRAASSASVTSTRQCGTETSVGCSSHVMGFSCSPRSSSSSATWASWTPTIVASAPVGGHQGRGCFSQPAASAPSTKCRSPVNGAT